jgi:hypothetical protein
LAGGWYRTLSSYLLVHFYLMKNSAKVLRKPFFVPVRETPNRPPNMKCIVPAFFVDRFVEKEVGLRTQNLFAGEIEGFELFLY